MAQLQRVLTLSKRLNITFRDVYLNFTCRRQPLHRQDLLIPSTVGKSKFHSFNCFEVKNFEQPTKQFCTAAKQEILENKESEDAENALLPKSLCDINLSDPDMMNTFRTLYQIYMVNKFNRSSNFESDLQAFVSSDAFRNFCDSLEKKLPGLSAQDLKSLLNCAKFKIPSSSVLMQKIYHLIIEKINDYSALEIVSIYVTVSASPHRGNPKSKILQLICKEYFGSKLFNNIEMERDYNSIALFCKEDRLPLSVSKKLLLTLGKNFSTIHEELTLNSLSRIFRAFSSKSRLRCFKPEMYDVLKARLTEAPTYSQTRNILMGLKQLTVNELSYDESFLDILVEKQLERGLGTSTTSDLIKLFLELEYLPMPLVRHLEKTFADPNYKLESHELGLSIARVLSNVFYHPLGYSGDDANHVECIKKLESLSFERLDMNVFTRWCLYLTALGSQRKIEYLNQLFNHLKDTFDNNEDKVDLAANTVEAIITLNAFARRHFPDDVVKLPETFLKKCYNAMKTEFTKAMHQAICKFLDGNPGLEYCRTSAYHFIDFAVLVNQDNEPIQATINSEHNSPDDILVIEDLKESPSSKLILFQLYRGDHPVQFKNSPTIPGLVQLYLQSFEPLDCRIVLLHDKELRRLNIKHREPYLVKMIKTSLK